MKKSWELLDVSKLNFNDKKTWELIQKGDTDGVFQLESSGMKETCKRVKPTCMEELIAILALYRPDTMRELEHYIKRKHGEEEITYIHPDLKPILESTYGCMIYQEQIMAVTKVFAGFSDGEADKFRKGIGKKKPEIVKEQADKFHDRCLQKGYPKEIAEALTKLLRDMGGYSFNKGHSTAYAITSYKTAYLKANYPILFMCSLLNHQIKPTGSTDYEKLSLYIYKSIEMGIKINYPDINKSDELFNVKNNEMFYGLKYIKGVGENAIKTILKLRPFNSFEDFLEKTKDSSNINKTVVISLIKAGAFDFTNKSRKELLEQYGEYRFINGLETIKKISNINKKHINDLLKANIIKENEAEGKSYCLEKYNQWKYLQFKQQWEEKEMAGNEYKWEYDSISYYLKGNPFDKIKLPKWSDYEEGDKNVKVGGTIISIKKTKIKKGKQKGKTMAFISLDTSEGMRDVTVFATEYEKHQDQLEKGNMVVIKGEKQGESLIMNGLKTLEKYIATEY